MLAVAANDSMRAARLQFEGCSSFPLPFAYSITSSARRA